MSLQRSVLASLNGLLIQSRTSVPPRTPVRYYSASPISSNRTFRNHGKGVRLSDGLEQLPISTLFRNIFLGAVFSSPLLSRAGLSMLRKVAETDSRLLNPDRNKLLGVLLKVLLYDHFCAGTSSAEVQQTRDTIKRIGFSGIALCYGKEIQVRRSNELTITNTQASREIEQWRLGTLETIDLIQPGDWLGIKFTGAGSSVTSALLHNQEAPTEFTRAMEEICSKAATKDCRIWIDAEQQVLQPRIDRWTIDLMRQHNRHGRVLVYNTLQAYLKVSHSKLKTQIELANKEGWALAVKLVRGAYIDTDQRSLIHDTKQATDDSYNGIVRDLLTGTNLGFTPQEFPTNIHLLIAGHNPESVGVAWELIQSLHKEKKLKMMPEFAQLQGMGDVLGCRYLGLCRSLDESGELGNGLIMPKFYKCLTWGSVQECMQYLFRRAVENRGGTDRMRDGMVASRNELWQRLKTGGIRNRQPT